MRYRMILVMAFLIAAMTISVVRGAVATTSTTSSEIESLTPKQPSTLSSVLSKRPIPLIEEAIVFFNKLSTFLSLKIGTIYHLRSLYISPDTPAPGIPIEKAGEGGITVDKTLLRYRKELVERIEGNVTSSITVSETNLKSGKYDGWIGNDYFLTCNLVCIMGKSPLFRSSKPQASTLPLEQRLLVFLLGSQKN